MLQANAATITTATIIGKRVFIHRDKSATSLSLHESLCFHICLHAYALDITVNVYACRPTPQTPAIHAFTQLQWSLQPRPPRAPSVTFVVLAFIFYFFVVATYHINGPLLWQQLRRALAT